MTEPKNEKNKNRKGIKNLVSMCCFIIVVVFYLFGLGEWFRPKGSSFDSYYTQPDNTIEVIMVGSSHVYSGYVPAVLWQEYGISAYNVYGWTVPAWTAYYYTKEALLTQDIDVVFLDVSSFAMGLDGEDTSDDDRLNLLQNINFNTNGNRYGLLMESSEIGDESVGFGGVNDLTLYHNKWKNPEALFTPYKPKVEAYSLRNFGALCNNLDIEVVNTSFYKDVQQPSARVMKYIDKFVELSKKEEFRLVFMLTPYTANREQVSVFNWTHEYADKNNIDFIDFFRAAGQECEFDFLYDMSDIDHVRYNGAVKLTRYLGEYLQKIGYQPPENTNKEQLDKDAASVYSILDELYQSDAKRQAESMDGEVINE